MLKWRENSERSAGFLKRIHKKHTIKQGIQSVHALDDGSPSSDPVTMRENTHKLYRYLYDTDLIDKVEVDVFKPNQC
ncbi:hypothetical protein BY458DRAFT_436127 [Sporodiniella umbellata]|nr:hypothetical protein BY458DRAFT_436127 [Sporodiniella umbellata]